MTTTINPKYKYTHWGIFAATLGVILIIYPFVETSWHFLNLSDMSKQICIFSGFVLTFIASFRLTHERDIERILNGQITTDGYKLFCSPCGQVCYADGMRLKDPTRNADGTYTAKP